MAIARSQKGLAVRAVGCVTLILWPTQAGILLTQAGILLTQAGILLTHALFGFRMVIPGLQGQASLSVSAEEQGSVGGLVAAAMAAGYAIGPVLGAGLYAFLPVLPYALDLCSDCLPRRPTGANHDPGDTDGA